MDEFSCLEVHFKLFGTFLAVYSVLDLHCTNYFIHFLSWSIQLWPLALSMVFHWHPFQSCTRNWVWGTYTESNDFDFLKCQRFNHNLTAWQIVQNKFLSEKRTTQSSDALVYSCPTANMSPIAPKLHGYQTYTTFHYTSMEHQVIDSEKSMPMTLYFAICKFSCSEIVFSKLPWRPPDGFVTLTFAIAFIFSIFSVIMICTCSCLCFTQLRQIKITRTILRETLYRLYLVLRELSQKITLRDTFQTIYLILRELAWKLIWILTLEASCTRLLGLTTLPLSILTQAFASEVIPFDTDSSF